MKILVTGASGFLGTRLCGSLEEAGHIVARLDSKNCDLAVASNLDCYNGSRFDQIFHLAAWTRAGDFCLTHPGEQWIINQQMNTNVLAWWHRCQPQAKLISMGTSCAYDPRLELVEENYLAGKPIESLFTYAMTKRMLYAGLLSLHQQFGLTYLHLVPSTLYGPGYHTDGRQMHFIFDLIQKILRGKAYGEPVVLWGDGYQSREVVYIDDFVRVASRLSIDCENDTVNVGAGTEFTIRQFAELICEYVGFSADSIQYDTGRYVGARSKCLSIGKLRRLVPQFGQVPLSVGLGRTIEWCQNHRS